MHTAACITTSLCFRVISHSTGCEHHTICVVLHLEMCIRYTSGFHCDIFMTFSDMDTMYSDQFTLHSCPCPPPLWWCHSEMFFLFLTRSLLLSCLLFWEDLTMYPWLAWSLLYRPNWPRKHRFACLWLPTVEMRGVIHHTWLHVFLFICFVQPNEFN